MDLPGHGRHAGRRGAWRFTLEAVEASIEGAAGADPPDLVGYSMGGRLALAYTVRNPGRVGRLVLESSSPGLETEAERRARTEEDERLAGRIEAQGVEPFVAYWEALPLFETQARLAEAVRARQRAIRLGNSPHSLAAALRGLGTGALPSFWESLHEVRVPVLVVVGAMDRKFVEIGRQMLPAFPDARLVEVPEAGHTVHLERPEAWLEAVTAFLGEGRAHQPGSA